MSDKTYIHSTTNADGDWESERLGCGKQCAVSGVAVANKGAVDFWLWICDSSTKEADKPFLCPILVPAGQSNSLDWSLRPVKMLHGVYVCATTDPLTKTLITTQDAYFDIAYENIRG
jgi:hypothetical protein